METIRNFLNKPETDSDDLVVILNICVFFTMFVVLIAWATGN